MILGAFVAESRLAIFEALKSGLEPPTGEFDLELLKEARTKGAPQLGTTTFYPDRIVLEYIFSDPQRAATVLPVTVAAPERIVFMPVPEWVVESIWQGEVNGSFHFESDARELLERYASQLDEGTNAELFHGRRAIGKA